MCKIWLILMRKFWNKLHFAWINLVGQCNKFISHNCSQFFWKILGIIDIADKEMKRENVDNEDKESGTRSEDLLMILLWDKKRLSIFLVLFNFGHCSLHLFIDWLFFHIFFLYILVLNGGKKNINIALKDYFEYQSK